MDDETVNAFAVAALELTDFLEAIAPLSAVHRQLFLRAIADRYCMSCGRLRTLRCDCGATKP